LISVSSENLPDVITHFDKTKVPTHVLGTVTGNDDMVIEEVASLNVHEMSEIFEGVIPGIMDK